MGLSNSQVLSFMNENALITDLSLRFGVIGAGQKGNKDADIFAGYTYADGTQCYPSLAINFSKGDMIHLKNIPEEDRLHFDGFKGAARTPSLVVEMFDPRVNSDANKLRTQLAQAMERKFADVEHLFICAGAGGGVGTGFISLVLGLVQEEFFPVPITLLISTPFDDQTEMSNAILLMSELNEFKKLQDGLFEPGESKPIGSIILTDNKKLYNDFSGKKDNRFNSDKLISWKDEGNNAIISTIHESNVIPANFGSDNVTYDPSDFVKLIQLSGGFLSFHKAKLEAPFDADDLREKMKNSVSRGYFACNHSYETATMYGGFVLRPSSAAVFKDLKTEQTIKRVITEFNSTAQGKYGDPIWNDTYAVLYTMFSGMVMPNRVIELTEEYNAIKEKEKQIQSAKEVNVDISNVIENVKLSSFNPYQKRSANRFGDGPVSGGATSVFNRKTVDSLEESVKEEVEVPVTPQNKFGNSGNAGAVWSRMKKNKE